MCKEELIRCKKKLIVLVLIHLQSRPCMPYDLLNFVKLNINIVAAFRGMHVSPAKHSYA